MIGLSIILIITSFHLGPVSLMKSTAPWVTTLVQQIWVTVLTIKSLASSPASHSRVLSKKSGKQPFEIMCFFTLFIE